MAALIRATGWQDRGLLVEEGLDGRLYAWTGSHRIAAAQAAGLAEVPCRVITRAETELVLARLPDPVGYLSLRDALMNTRNGGGASDEQRLAGIRQVGLHAAAAALEEEIRADEW
jgi:hypothetical protein